MPRIARILATLSGSVGVGCLLAAVWWEGVWFKFALSAVVFFVVAVIIAAATTPHKENK